MTEHTQWAVQPRASAQSAWNSLGSDARRRACFNALLKAAKMAADACSYMTSDTFASTYGTKSPVGKFIDPNEKWDMSRKALTAAIAAATKKA